MHKSLMTALPTSCNRGDHLVRTLVAARYSTLYLRANLVLSVALGRGPRAGEPPTANTYVRLSKKCCILVMHAREMHAYETHA
jgi:hypothetical protein